MESFFRAIFFGWYPVLYFILFCASLIVCLLIIKYNPQPRRASRAASDLKAVQSAHVKPVPRLGGLAFFIGVLLLFPLTAILDLNTARLTKFVPTLLPIFVIGLAEDLGYYMRPLYRLLAIIVSGALTIAFFNLWITRVGVPGLDYLLAFSAFAIAFTLFTTTGVTNAFNLIDGLNGLSSFVAMSTALALAAISHIVSHPDMSIFLTIIIACVFGFFVVNFPFGKMFLGDGGAYMLGHTLVWFAIALMAFAPAISPFAILLIFFWPIADTLIAIWRRWKLGVPHDRPDRLHFHQLVMRFLEIRFLGRQKRLLANPLATVCLMPFIVVPQVLGVLFALNHKMAVLSSVLLAATFVLTYFMGMRMAARISMKKPISAKTRKEQ